MKKYIHLTAGRGPTECQYVVAKVLGIMIAELENMGIKVYILHRAVGDINGTLQSATIALDDVFDLDFMKDWLGTILWIEKSTFRKTHKRKNWYIGVYEVKNYQEISLNESDLTFQTMRSGGSGGQNVNKVNSAVRVKHKSSGITAFAQDSRSQHQNKKLAIERLREKWNAMSLEKVKRQIEETWEQHLSIERGSPVRTFSGDSFRKKKEEKKYKRMRNQLKQEWVKNDSFLD